MAGGQRRGARPKTHYQCGFKLYEQSNHLGNVLVTLTDKQRGIDASSNGTLDYYLATVQTATHYYPFGWELVAMQYGAGYRYGYNGMEKSPEIGSGHHTTLFRENDSRSPVWWSIDPKTTAGESPYVMINNNPISITDIKGNSGEPVIKDGIMYIYMDFYFYGNGQALEEGNRQANISNAVSYLQEELNRYSYSSQGPDGIEYPVVFQVNGQYVTEAEAQKKAIENIWENFNPRLNLVRVEDNISARNSSQKNLKFDNDGIPKERTSSNNGPDNSLIIGSEDLATSTWIHEVVAHQLGNRGAGAHIEDWNTGVREFVPADPNTFLLTPLDPVKLSGPSIQTHRFTTNVPSEYTVPFTDRYGQTGMVLDISKRQVLSMDKAKMQLRWIQGENNSWKGQMGGATNTYFEKDGSEKID